MTPTRSSAAAARTSAIVRSGCGSAASPGPSVIPVPRPRGSPPGRPCDRRSARSSPRRRTAAARRSSPSASRARRSGSRAARPRPGRTPSRTSAIGFDRQVGLGLGVDDVAAAGVPVGLGPRPATASPRRAASSLATSSDEELPGQEVAHQVAAGPAVGRLDRPLQLLVGELARAPRTAARRRVRPRGRRERRCTSAHPNGPVASRGATGPLFDTDEPHRPSRLTRPTTPPRSRPISSGPDRP